MAELLFEKEYELLQAVGYPYQGKEKKTKNVVLKAPTFKQCEQLEAAERQLNRTAAFIKFICDSGLIVVREDGREIAVNSIYLNDLHIKAIGDLLINYNKFFLAADIEEIEKKS